MRPARAEVVVDLAIAPRRRPHLGGLAGIGRRSPRPGEVRPDPAVAGRSRSCRRPRIPVEVEIVDPHERRARPGAGPVRDRRRPLPAAARPPRRDQPGLLRGHRRRPDPRLERPMPTSPAGSRSTCRSGRSTSRSSAASTGGPSRPARDRPARPGASSCRSSGPSTSHAGRWVTADTHVHFLAAVDGPAAGGRRGRRPRQPPRGPVGRPVHERDRPARGARWPTRRGRRMIVVGTENRQNMLGHLALLGAHRPTSPLASGGPPEGRMAGALERPARRLGRSLPGRRRARRRGPLSAALRRDRGRHRRRQDRRDRDPGAVAGPGRPVGPRVVPLPQPRLPAAGRGRHRQDVRRGAGRRGPDVRPPARRRRALTFDAWAAAVRAGPDVRHARAGPRARASTATSRATVIRCRRPAASRSWSGPGPPSR